jgi:hypothetical protein
LAAGVKFQNFVLKSLRQKQRLCRHLALVQGHFLICGCHLSLQCIFHIFGPLLVLMKTSQHHRGSAFIVCCKKTSNMFSGP